MLSCSASTPSSHEPFKTIAPLLQMTAATCVQPTLVLEEERSKDGVPVSAYIAYFSQVRSTFITFTAISFLVLAQLAEASTTVWLGYFTKRSIKGLSDRGYVGIYFALGLAYVTFEVRPWYAYFAPCTAHLCRSCPASSSLLLVCVLRTTCSEKR